MCFFFSDCLNMSSFFSSFLCCFSFCLVWKLPLLYLASSITAKWVPCCTLFSFCSLRLASNKGVVFFVAQVQAVSNTSCAKQSIWSRCQRNGNNLIQLFPNRYVVARTFTTFNHTRVRLQMPQSTILISQVWPCTNWVSSTCIHLGKRVPGCSWKHPWMWFLTQNTI